MAGGPTRSWFRGSPSRVHPTSLPSSPCPPPRSRSPSCLRTLRERPGLTQEELAERAGLTPHAVSALERGARTRPYPHTVRSLADALGLDDAQRAALLAAVPRRQRRRRRRRRAAGRVGPAPGPLPVPPTALLGRDDEVAALTALLVAAACGW